MENNKQPILSVIIPMYNCAPVITRCLDSIDYPNAEIIVVNDGSKDNGAEVVTQYAISHPNVKLFNKENGGVSTARNLGIEVAQGKYISFIDADDYIVEGGLERITRLAEDMKADVVKYKWINVKEDDVIDQTSVANYPIQIMETSGEDVLNRCDISDYIVWDGIYKRNLIEDNKLQFMTDLTLHEDDVFMGMLYCHARKVIATDLPLYRYVMASNYSSTHRQSIEKQLRLIRSGLLATRYRGEYVSLHYPEASRMEKLKYMRWVCQVKSAIAAEMTLDEYEALLEEYRQEGVYPLEYKWIRVAGWELISKAYLKYLIKTWMVNHPRIAYAVYRGKR